MLKFIIPAVLIFLIVLFWEEINKKLLEKFNIRISKIILFILAIFLGTIVALLYF
tara:strand:+ start:109 stop:273 length:165 start_codon:yes stop_codon:yes gene_type:complete